MAIITLVELLAFLANSLPANSDVDVAAKKSVPSLTVSLLAPLTGGCLSTGLPAFRGLNPFSSTSLPNCITFTRTAFVIAFFNFALTTPNIFSADFASDRLPGTNGGGDFLPMLPGKFVTCQSFTAVRRVA